MTFYDAVFNVRIIPNINIIENNRILDVTVISNVRFFKNTGVFYCSIDNGSTQTPDCY